MYLGTPGGRLRCMSSVVVKQPVLVPFLCPICAAPNAVNLILLSRAGQTTCGACSKRLRSQDVMRAMHAPRKPS